MNKQQIIDNVANHRYALKGRIAEAFDGIFGEIISAVCRGEEVSITGFGKFHPQRQEARDGRNPQTGEAIKIPAKRVAKFKAAKAFSDAVNG